MATNWVSQNGTAAWNSSSAGNPCSIAVMNSNISPGDTAYLLTGSFTSRIKPVKSGTSDTTRIRIVANVLDGVADEEVTGTHKSSFPDFSSAPQPCIDFSGLDFVTVSGIKLDGTFLAPSSNLPEANIVLGNTNNCIGKHLVYANTGGSVIGSIHETGPHSDCQFLYCDLSYVGNWKITNPDLTVEGVGVHVYSNSISEAKRLVLYKNNLHWAGSKCIDIKGHDCFILENSIRNDWEYLSAATGELLAGDYAGNLGADIGSSGTAGGTNTGVRNRFIKNVVQHTARSIDNADVEALKLSGNQTIARGNVVFDHKAGQAITSTTGAAASAPATNMRISHNTIAYINGSGWGLLANNKPGAIAETGNIFKNNIVNNVVLSPLNARSNLTSSPYKSYPIYLVDLITYAGLDKFGNNKIISNLLPANCEVAFSITDVDTITNLETTFGTNVSGNIQSDTPGFVNSLSPYLVTSGTVGSPSINVTLDTFEISSSSPAYLSAEEETNTVNSGTGTKITVADASWFHDGGASTGGIISSVDGITVQPDIITIGNNSPVNILAINYSTNQIDVDSPITWNSGDPVRLSNYLNIGAWQAATVEGILARPNVYTYPNNTTWPLQLSVLDNDIDINGSSPPTGLIVSSVVPGIGCHQTNTKINAGDNTVVDFEPLAGFIGEARFTYTAYDSINDLSSTTTVSVNISQASTGTGATLVNDTFETNGYLNGQIESVSGNSWKASVGTTSSTVKKWYPGHYVMQGETNDAKNKIAQYDQFVGAKLKFFWKNLEPTEGVFDFSEIEADVQSLWQTGNGKRSLIMIGIKEHNFSKLEYTAAPDWLGVYDAMDNVWLSPPNPDHPNDPGAYYYLSGSSTPDPKLAVAIWKPWVREKVDNLFRALGEAYDNDDRISFISLDETALSNPPADITPTPQEYLTGLIETEKSLASHFPKTPALQLANFISSDEPGMLSIFENMESIGGGISGPDLFDTYLDGDGLPKTQAYELYPEFAGRIPLAIENQRADRIASAGPAVAYDVAINSLSCNVIFWNTKFDGDPNWDFYTGIIPVLESNNWFIHTDRPSNLSEPIPPSTVKKWNPGHYIKGQAGSDPVTGYDWLFNEADYSIIKGTWIQYNWYELEAEEDLYDFTVIRQHLNAYDANKKFIVICPMYTDFSADNPLGLIPGYILNDPKYGKSDNGTGDWYGVAKTNNGWILRFWDPICNERYTRLLEALAKEFDDEPYIAACLANSGESAYAMGTVGSPSDLDAAAEVQAQINYKTRMSRAVVAWNKTPVFMGLNFPIDRNNDPNLVDTIKNMYDVRGCMSEPDLTGRTGNYPLTAQATFDDGNYINKMARATIVSNQVVNDGDGDLTPTECFNLINQIGYNYVFWIPLALRDLDGISVINANNGDINTTLPENLGSSTPTTPGTLNWQPGHYVRMQDGAKGKEETSLSYIWSTPYDSVIKGAKIQYTWLELERNKGVYDFSQIYSDLAFLTAHGKTLTIMPLYKDNKISNPYLSFPEWLINDPYYPACGNCAAGTDYYGVSYSATGDGYIAKIWNDRVADEWIKLIEALGNEFKDNPDVVAIIASQESARGFAGNPEPDFDGEKFYINTMRIADAAIASFPSTPVFIGANHVSTPPGMVTMLDGIYQRNCGLYEADCRYIDGEYDPAANSTMNGGTQAQDEFELTYRGDAPKNAMARMTTISASVATSGTSAPFLVDYLDRHDYNFVYWTNEGILDDKLNGINALISAGVPINTILPTNLENLSPPQPPTLDTGSVVVSANRVTHTAADVGAYINSKATTDRVLSVDLDFKNDLNNTIKIFPCRTNITDFDASSAEAIEVRINGGNGRIVVNHFDAGGLRTQLGGPWTIPIPIGQINVKVDWDPTNNIGKVLIDDISIGTFSQPEPPGGAGAQSFHPGHYVKAWTDQIKEDWAWIFSEPNVIGVMWEIAWNEIENDAGTAYDFTKLDENYNYLAAQGKYSIIELRDRHFEENNPNNTVLPTYLESPTYGGGYWVTHKTKDGVCIIRGICAVLWNSNLMDRYIALIQAVGAHMNGKPFFEGLQGGESSIGFGCEPSDPNYSPEGYVAQLKRQLDAGVAAVPNHWYALGGNFINDAGTSSTLIPELVDYMVANGGAIKEADLHTDFGGRNPTPFQLYIYDNYVGDLVQSTIGSASALDNDTEEDLWNWVMDPAHGITHACWNGTWWNQTSVLDRINAVGGVSGWMQCPTNIDCLGGGTGGTLEICNLPYTGWYVTNIGTSALTLDNYNITQASGGTTGITITQATIDGDADFGVVKHNSAQITHDILALGYFTNPTGGTVTIQQPTGSWNTLNCTVTTNGSTILFDPGSNVGSYSYTYTLRDSLNNTATGVVSGTLGNTLPVPASNVFLKASKGGSTFVNPKTGLTIPTGLSTGSAWAADADGDTIVYAQSVAPAHGSLSITSSGIEYTHDNSSNFFDSFVLTVYDGFAYGNNLNVNVQISGIQANNDIASIPQNAKYDGTINSKTNIFVLNNDIGTNLTIYKLNNVVQTTPIQVRTNHGYVIRNSNYVIYQPDTDYIGQDSFTYEIVDASSEFSSATVTINVYLEDEEDPNSQIIVTNDTYTIGAGTGLQVLIPSPLSNDIVVNVNRIITETYTEEEITETTTEEFLTETTATYSIGALSNIFGGSFNIINNGADVDFTPTIDSGIATATYEIYGDGFPLSPPVYGNIYITVEPQLYAPDVTMSISALPGEETEILINAADLVYSALTGPQVYSITAQPALGSAIIDPNTGIITYTITTSVNWSDTIGVRVTQDGIIVDFTITLLGLVKTGNQDWLETDNNKIILVEAGYHNGTETSVGYFGTFPYILKQGDSFIDIYGNTVNSIYYDEIVNDIPEVSSRIDLSSTIGAIELLNPEGDLDELLKYGWEGHPLKIYLGDPLWTKEQFILIFDGIINKFTSSSVDKVTIDVRDKDQILSVSVQSNTITLSYVENILASSTFSADTKDVPPVVFDPDIVSIPESIVNTLAPICLGYCFNISPKLIDAYNHVYQIHDGSIQAITEVRSNGAVVDTGDYEVDLSKGCFRLLVHDLGQQITCDVIGQSTRSSLAETSPGVYPYSLVLHSAAHLIEWLLLEKTSVTIDNLDPDSFDPNGVNGFPNTSVMGLYIEDEEEVKELLNKISSSVGAFIRFNKTNNLVQLTQFKDPATQPYSLELPEDQILENGLTLSDIEIPKKNIKLSYKKNWTVQDKGALAGIVVEQELEVLENITSEYKIVNVANPITYINDMYPLLEEDEVQETLLYNKQDALNEANRRIQLRKQKRFIYSVQATAVPLTINVGSIIKITHFRFDFSSGKKGLVIGINEDPINKFVTLEVWI